jgi:hypothetical protein
MGKHSRDKLINAIQKYAESWAANTETMVSHPGKTALCIALDEYEFEFLNEISELKEEIIHLKSSLEHWIGKKID